VYGRIDSERWHQRIEREYRGRRVFEGSDHAHMCVKIVFQFFETQTAPCYMAAPELLMTYEALNLLLPMSERHEESMFRDAIRLCRYSMIERLNGQIPPEMGRFIINRDADSLDRLSTVGDHLSWNAPASSKKSLYTR
jgi:hypothetical protein